MADHGSRTSVLMQFNGRAQVFNSYITFFFPLASVPHPETADKTHNTSQNLYPLLISLYHPSILDANPKKKKQTKKPRKAQGENKRAKE